MTWRTVRTRHPQSCYAMKNESLALGLANSTSREEDLEANRLLIVPISMSQGRGYVGLEKEREGIEILQGVNG